MKKYLLIFMVLGLSGCSSFWGKVLEKPKIELDHVSLKDSTFKGTTLIFTFSVDNPNSTDIKVDQVTYKVFLNSKEITQAKTDKPVVAPAKSKVLVDLPLPVEYTKIFSDLKDLMFAESASYKITGDAKVSMFTIPFTKEGRVNLR